jgi:glycosyltransferase involved in cell wall biosynthesis
MKICLVTTFPPSQGGLSEYGLHIAQELHRNPFISLTILADELPEPLSELQEFSVNRCWSFDDPGSAVRLIRVIRKLKPDVVWFNLLFSTFGRNPINAFLGLLTPLLARLNGRYTHVTLHHLMDTVDLNDAGVRHKRIYRWAGSVATRMILLSNSVSVLMPGYRKILHDKYGRDNVHLRSHGILTRRPEYPQFSRRGNPEHRILAFGKWGTYKRLELMIDAFRIVSKALPDARLVVAGGDHPQSHGYVASMKEKHESSTIQFTGYVEEDKLPELFQQSTVAAMPYSSSTGCSGVAHLACAYGVPILCADLPDFRQMADGEDLAIEFHKPGDAEDLARSLISLLTDSEKQKVMAVHNFSTALRMTMPTVVQKYLRHFELEQRTETLRQITRFRRLPGWVPSRTLLLRLMKRNSHGWVHRSAVHLPLPNFSSPLLNDDIDGGGKPSRAGVPVNGDGIAARLSRGIPAGSAPSGTAAAAGRSEHRQAENGNQSQNLTAASPAGLTGKHQAGHSEGQQEKGEDWIQVFRPQSAPDNGSGGNGKGGARTTGAGSNAGGAERATESAGQPAARERDSAVE